MNRLSLYNYQKCWIADDSRFKIGMQARQTGKTFTTTLEIVKDAFTAEAEGRRTRWVILSRGERQAREAMEEGVKRHCQAYNLGVKSLESEFRGSDGTYKQLEIILPNGSRITALPANPDTARGFSSKVFLDEFAFHADSRKIWAALFPVISNGFKIRITSTPNGKGNKFYELFTASDEIWSRHSTDIYQAIADGLQRNAEELRSALSDEDVWAQEYELQWLDEASAWLSYGLINGVEHDQAGKPAHHDSNPVYVGNDIGLRNDLWVVWVLEPIGDVLWTREIIARQRIPFAEQDAILDDVFRSYPVARLCMDQTGMGEKPVEDAQRRYGEHRVEGVIMTTASKLVLATLGKQAFEDKKIRIPLGDEALRADLHKLKKTTTTTGQPRFIADTDNTGHADRAWACFLALNAAQTPPYPIESQSNGQRREINQSTFEAFGATGSMAGF